MKITLYFNQPRYHKRGYKPRKPKPLFKREVEKILNYFKMVKILKSLLK